MEAEDSKKGMKGRCPVCKTAIVVPAHSQRSLIFDGDRIAHIESITENLLREVQDKHGDKIIKHTQNDQGDAIAFRFKTDTHGERSQSVCVYVEPPVKGFSEYKSVVVSSKIGHLNFVEDKNDLVELIKTVDSFHFLNLHINKNDEAEIVFRGPFTTTNVSVVADMIALVANCADNIESRSGTDRY
jgi:hypothetical protein